MDIKEVIAQVDKICESPDGEKVAAEVREVIKSYEDAEPMDYMGQCFLYNELGSVLRHRGLEDLGVTAFSKGLELAKKLSENAPDDKNVKLNLATCMNNLAGSYRLKNEPVKALELFDSALALYSEMDDVPDNMYASGYNNMGLVFLQMKDGEDAKQCLETSMSIVEGEGYAKATSLMNLALAYILSAEKLLDDAKVLFDEDGECDNLAENCKRISDHLKKII